MNRIPNPKTYKEKVKPKYVCECAQVCVERERWEGRSRKKNEEDLGWRLRDKMGKGKSRGIFSK